MNVNDDGGARVRRGRRRTAGAALTGRHSQMDELCGDGCLGQVDEWMRVNSASARSDDETGGRTKARNAIGTQETIARGNSSSELHSSNQPTDQVSRKLRGHHRGDLSALSLPLNTNLESDFGEVSVVHVFRIRLGTL